MNNWTTTRGRDLAVAHACFAMPTSYAAAELKPGAGARAAIAHLQGSVGSGGRPG